MINRTLGLLCLSLALLFGVQLVAQAQQADSAGTESYQFDSAEQEQQFRQLTGELRCPKCQNQSIADSDAPLAKDLRDRVYQMLKDGDSRDEIIDFMTARYGDFVHYRPPVNSSTMVLWLAPLAVFLSGVIAVLLMIRGQGKENSELSSDEQARLQRLLRQKDDN